MFLIFAVFIYMAYVVFLLKSAVLESKVWATVYTYQSQERRDITASTKEIPNKKFLLIV